ncbi:MAG: hypothetical protein GF350_12025, partial [Chitinivibrionales bacterium]|nr:hypothetical protein [Chitinivibrionales bacterium]
MPGARKGYKRALFLSVVILCAIAAVILYSIFISPTRIAFVNFQDFQYMVFHQANDNPFIQVDRLDISDGALPNFGKYDAVYFFSMGLHLTREQRDAIFDATIDGTAIYVYGSATTEKRLTNLSPATATLLKHYFGYGGVVNARRLLNYSRKVLDGKLLFVQKLEEPFRIPQEAYFHLGEQDFFETIDHYQSFYEQSGHFKQNAPRVLLLCSNLGPHTPTTVVPIRSLIAGLQNTGFNVYPVTGFFKRLERIKESNPDLIVFVAHGRLAPGKTDESVALLNKLNIPLLCPVVLFQSYDEWIEGQKGMAGGMFGQNIVVPELDGGIVPFLIGAQFPNEQGLMAFGELPERIKKFSRYAKKYLALSKKENSEKKVAIVYYKGPGRNALSATGLDVVPSLLNLLQHLKKSGYTTGPLPETEQELFDRIQQEGLIAGSYARGVQQGFLEHGNPERIYADELNTWINEEFPPEMSEAVNDVYGKAPGTFFSGIDSLGNEFVAVPRIRFGNIVIMPQLLPGKAEETKNGFKAIKFPPPYPYIASYLWIRKGLEADALIHFGTYGSFEFLPLKQPPLSQYDWPDALIGTLPHLYIYCVESVGDALVAKRRSYATIISHLTPPFKKSGTYGPLHELKMKFDAFYSAPSAGLKEQYRSSLFKLMKKSGIDTDLGLTIDHPEQLRDEKIARMANYVQEIAEEKIHEGLYRLGEQYTDDQLISTCKEIYVDMLARKMADIDIFFSKITSSSIDDYHFFNSRYRTKAYAIADALLRGRKMPDEFISPQNRMALERLKKNESKTPAQTRKMKALEEYIRVIERLRPCYHDLKGCSEAELDAITNALNGGYTIPSSGGDPIVNPGVIPTGRNLFGINADKTPDE